MTSSHPSSQVLSYERLREEQRLTHEELFNRIQTQFFLLESNLVCTGSESNGERSNDFSESSGEKNDLRILSHSSDQAIQYQLESVSQARDGKDQMKGEAYFFSEMDCSPIEPESSMLSASSRTNALISFKSKTRARVTICTQIRSSPLLDAVGTKE